MTTEAIPSSRPHAPLAAAPAGPALIEMAGVSRAFGGAVAVEKLDVVIREGEIFALIGPSGAGKTTVLRMLAGLIVPTSGTLNIFGRAPRKFTTRERAMLGYVPQAFVLYPDLTIEQNARFMAGLYGIGWWRRRRRIRDALRVLDLWSVRRRRAANISGGMKRRLMLACALLHSPRLLLVDEPTAGLDPRLRATIWEHLRRLRDAGTTVVITTQYLEEAEHCDRVGIMNETRLVALGTPRQLREHALGGQAIDVETGGYSRADMDALAAIRGVRKLIPRGSALRFVVADAAAATPAVMENLRNRNIAVESIQNFEPSFDEVFLAFVDGRSNGRRP
jgi:ABC-2 type transport system ATP-binding protein